MDWSEDDQDDAIGWMLRERSRCPSCGTVPAEWLEEDGTDVEPPPYEVKSSLCIGCAEIDDKSKTVPEKDRHKYHVYLAPRRPSGPDRQDRTPG